MMSGSSAENRRALHAAQKEGLSGVTLKIPTTKDPPPLTQTIRRPRPAKNSKSPWKPKQANRKVKVEHQESRFGPERLTLKQPHIGFVD